MVDRNQINFFLQIIGSMEETVKKLEEAHENKDKENLELAKKELLDLQKRLKSEIR